MTDFVRRTLESARLSLRAGDVRHAETLLRQILEREPAHPESLHALGRIALQAGRDGDALPLIRRAVAGAPDRPGYHADLAVALQNLGWNEEAIAEARAAIAIDPRNLSAWNTLGNALRSLGRAEEAAARFAQAVALGPEVAVLHLNLAAALRDAGRLDDAAMFYRRASALVPGNADALVLLGTLERERGRLGAAAAALEEAVALDASHADAVNALGNVRLDQGDAAAAEACYRRALALKPGSATALVNLGNVLRTAGRTEEAHAAYAAALETRPDSPAARLGLAQTTLERGRLEEAIERFAAAEAVAPGEGASGLGGALRAAGRFEEAAAAYARAALALPEDAEVRCNESTVLLDLGRIDEAVDRAQRAIALAPSLAEPHWNLAQAWLARGALDQGWEKYEYRLLKRGATELAFPWPLWDGAPLARRTLFVAAEQGVGDEILFASCVPDVAREAARTVLECDARLVPLFARAFPGVTPIARLARADAYPAGLPAPDLRIAIGSLPRFFRRDFASFPARGAYLAADPERIAAWRARYAALGAGLKVGITWRGGKEALVRRARSIPLAAWARLASAAPVVLIDLQYGDHAAERRAGRESHGLELHHFDDADPLHDLDGLAAQIAALDLVISVDNATVHLAGALGAPTWVLLPVVCDWRWMEEREDSPWYASVRLFRQSTAGEWDDVLARVERELRKLPGERGSKPAESNASD